MSKNRKPKDIGIAIGVTLLAHAMLIGLLFYIHLTTQAPQKQHIPELVLVNAGNTDLTSMGDEEPLGNDLKNPQSEANEPQNTQEPSNPSATAPQTAPREPLATQKTEPSINAAELEKKKKKKEEDIKKRQEEERKKKEAQEAERKKKIEAQVGNNVAGAFNGSKAKTSNQGTGNTAQGNQGNPNGSGDSYSLTGRTIISNGGMLTRPNDVKPIRGRIKVRIIVNSSGKVTDAWIEPNGTQISDATMRASSVAAAKATRFNAVSAGNDQRGIITYYFDVK